MVLNSLVQAGTLRLGPVVLVGVVLRRPSRVRREAVVDELPRKVGRASRAEEYAQGLGKRAAAGVLSNVTIIERGLLADRADAKKYAYGNAERDYRSPSYGNAKPKQPEVKFELGLTHVQAWSQFERTGTIDRSQLAQPKIDEQTIEERVRGPSLIWSPDISWLCSENYWYGLPDDVQRKI